MKRLIALTLAATLTGCGTYQKEFTAVDCAWLIIGSLGALTPMCVKPSEKKGDEE